MQQVNPSSNANNQAMLQQLFQIAQASGIFGSKAAEASQAAASQALGAAGAATGAASDAASEAAAINQAYGETAQQVIQTIGDVGTIVKSNATEEEKTQAVKERVAIAVADYYTGGYASKALAFANQQWPGTMGKIRKFGQKIDLVGKYLTKLWDTDKWKTEGNRMNKLLESGINIPEEFLGSTKLTRGRTDEELMDNTVPPDFVGFKPDGTWVNNVFTQSRNEADLKPQDIAGFATFFEHFGNDWLQKFSSEQRLAIADSALKLGLVREHHGTMDVTWSPELESVVAQIAQGATSNTNAPSGNQTENNQIVANA